MLVVVPFCPMVNFTITTEVLDRWPLVSEAPFRSQASTCGICGGQSGTGTGLSQGISVFTCQDQTGTRFRHMLVLFGIS
jgi:hypothetical protein